MEVSRVSQTPFGTLPDGVLIQRYTLVNAHGLELQAITYGGIIASLRTPDRRGERAGIVLGFDSLTGYLPNPQYLGAIVGRYANRIAGGGSLSTARATSWPSTTAYIICTAVRAVSIGLCGRASRSRPTARWA